MRIAICGPNRGRAIAKVEDNFRLQAKKPWIENGNIIDYAAETYKYLDDTNVVFDGSAFDFLSKSEGEGYDEVYEEIALSSLANLDYVAVILDGMDNASVKMYKEYAKVMPEKFHLYNFDTDFEVVLR